MPIEADVDSVRLEIRKMRQQAIMLAVIVLPVVILFFILSELPPASEVIWLGWSFVVAALIATIGCSSALGMLLLLSAYMKYNLLKGMARKYSREEKRLYMLIFLMISAVVLAILWTLKYTY